MDKPWFGAKTFGIGVGPKSWKGWSALGGYVVLVGASNGTLHALHGPAGADVAATSVLTAGFVLLMVAKSDGRLWRWRWGERD